MSNLLELAIQKTKENVVKKARSKSINDRIESLLENGEKLTRTHIVGAITLQRMEESEDEKITKKSFENDEFVERFNKMNKTVKNGVDTALSPNSKNNASFSYNKKYDKWILNCDEDGLYSIELKG